MPDKRRTGLPTPRRELVVAAEARASQGEHRRTRQLAAGRRQRRLSPKGSQQRTYETRSQLERAHILCARRRPERCMARLGHQKGVAKGAWCCGPLTRMGIHVHSRLKPNAQFAACSGRVADSTCLLAEYAIRTLGGEGGTPRKGHSYPVGFRQIPQTVSGAASPKDARRSSPSCGGPRR